MGRQIARQQKYGRKVLLLSNKRRSRKRAQEKKINNHRQIVKGDCEINKCSFGSGEINFNETEQVDVDQFCEGVPEAISNPDTCKILITSGSESNLCNDKPSEIFPQGRRLVDIEYFFKQLPSVFEHGPTDCTVSCMYIVSEVRKGLNTTYRLKCRMCNIEKELKLNDDRENDLNSSVVLATISSGSGYTGTEEILSILNVPFMSPKTYQHYQSTVAEQIHSTALDSMKEAGKEEARLSLELGEVDKDNVPYITVIADGTYSKRSYNVNYNAASGAACIIGLRTRKLLYLGIRNKYCCVCAHAKSKHIMEIPEHKCFLNWKGSSTSMESDIIVEGFQQSLKMHGMKYLKLVGDGDSSVHKKLIEARPYGNTLVQKIECKNHLMRNFSKKLKEICNRKRSNAKNMVVPPYLRKVVENNSARLRTAISKSIAYRRNKDKGFNEKVVSLCKDMKNAPSHVFGEHNCCREINYFCCIPKENEKNFVPAMIQCGLYEDIQIVINRLVHNAGSLVLNMDTNLAEQYNSIICKFIGGKRINFTQKGSYGTRCEAAALSFNSDGDYYRVMHKSLTKKSSSGFTKKYIEKVKRRRLNRNKLGKIKKKLFRFKMNYAEDKDYGPEASAEPDIPPEIYERRKNDLMNGLKKTVEELRFLEESTRGQSSNETWKQERALRLTASNFGEVCKMRKSTSCQKIVQKLLYSKFMGNEHTKYGLDHEPLAIKEFENQLNVTVKPCGLFVDEKYFMFGASPDGLVNEDCIVEVKCPSCSRKLHPRDAVKEKIIKFAKINKNDNLVLKRTHNYYFQIQGQLHITNRQFCYFVVWSPLGILIEKIEKDTEFWETKSLGQILIFYNKCFLPELVDPRFTRGLPIRNPSRTLENI